MVVKKLLGVLVVVERLLVVVRRVVRDATGGSRVVSGN